MTTDSNGWSSTRSAAGRTTGTRVSVDGRGEHLEAVDDVYSFDPKAPAEEQATAREEFQRRNRELNVRLWDRVPGMRD